MAFMGIVLTFIVIIAIILGVSALIAIICFVSSGLIMHSLRKKNKDNGKVKQPWYVITLRVIGSLACVPFVLCIIVVIYAAIGSAIDKKTNLPRAVMGNDYEQAEEILKNGADPDVRDEYGWTLLMCIVDHHTYSSADDDGYYYYWSSYTAMDETDDSDIRMMKLLLDYGADIDAALPDCGDKSAHTYAEGGGTDVYANSDHSCGNTALIYAVRYRSVEIVDFLLDNDADVNAENACGFTPILMCADMRTDDDDGLEIAIKLINNGADPNAVTNFRQNIIWLLSRRDPEENRGISDLIRSALNR